jgi:predicted protein tyrosine phosphatase
MISIEIQEDIILKFLRICRSVIKLWFLLILMVAKKYLFVCMANVNRSRLGKVVFSQMLTERGFGVYPAENYDFRVESAGLCARRDTTQFKECMLRGTRNVFFADTIVKLEFLEEYGISWKDRFVNLGIPDRWDIDVDWQRKELERILRTRLAQYVPGRKS